MSECKHWTGIQHDCCKAGINYRDLADDSRPGLFLRLPCFTPTVDRKGNVPVACDKFVSKSAVEKAAEDAAVDKAMADMRKVMPVVSAWRKKPPRGKSEVIECPVCNGRLHLTQSSYNGHVHGWCETAGCVHWME